MKFSINSSITLLSIPFILYLGFMTFYTYIHNGFVSYIEVAKFIIPLLSLFILGFIGDQTKLSLLKVGILFFLIHFFVSLFFYSSIELSDGRLNSILLGRGPNEFAFAIAFMIILLHNKDLLPRVMRQFISIRWLECLAYIVLLVLLFKTQSRSGFILIGVYFLFMHKSSILRLGYKKLYKETFMAWMLALIILSILGLILIETFFYTDKFNFRSFLSGRYDVWEKNILYFRSFNFVEVIFGSDFTTKNILLNDLRNFSDSHSLYLDFFKYFGLYGLFTLLAAIKLNCKKNQLSKAIFYAFLITNLVCATFRIPYVFYVNLLMFTMISIRWDLIK